MQGIYANSLAGGEWYGNVITRPLFESERILEHDIDNIRVRRRVLTFAWDGGAGGPACPEMRPEVMVHITVPPLWLHIIPFS